MTFLSSIFNNVIESCSQTSEEANSYAMPIALALTAIAGIGTIYYFCCNRISSERSRDIRGRDFTFDHKHLFLPNLVFVFWERWFWCLYSRDNL